MTKSESPPAVPSVITPPRSPAPPTGGPAVYLAGPDVFHPQSAQIGRTLSDLCLRHGLTPLYPSDNAIDPALPDAARLIYGANVDMLRRCAAVVANVAPWRGPNMDPGTAFEIGFAAALGKPVFIYTEGVLPWDEEPAWAALNVKMFPKAGEFGHSENLMCCVPAAGAARTAEEAIAMAQDCLLASSGGSS